VSQELECSNGESGLYTGHLESLNFPAHGSAAEFHGMQIILWGLVKVSSITVAEMFKARTIFARSSTGPQVRMPFEAWMIVCLSSVFVCPVRRLRPCFGSISRPRRLIDYILTNSVELSTAREAKSCAAIR
jgi:hypothetical protein